MINLVGVEGFEERCAESLPRIGWNGDVSGEF